MNEIKGMRILGNKTGVIFDVPQKNKELFEQMSGQMEENNFKCYAPTELPELLEDNIRNQSGNYNKNFGMKRNNFNNSRFPNKFNNSNNSRTFRLERGNGFNPNFKKNNNNFQNSRKPYQNLERDNNFRNNNNSSG